MDKMKEKIIMMKFISLAAASFFAAPGYANGNWYDEGWKTSSCPYDGQIMKFQREPKWDSERGEMIQNNSVSSVHEIDGTEVIVRWLGETEADTVELLCGEKTIFFFTNTTLIIQLGIPQTKTQVPTN